MKVSAASQDNRLYAVVEISLAILMVFATLQRGLWNTTFFIDLELARQANFHQLGINGLLVIGLTLLLIRSGALAKVPGALRDISPALPFLMLAAISLIWSADPVSSIFRIFFLLASAFYSLYLRTRYTNSQIGTGLAWAAVGLIIANFIALLITPQVSIMSNYAYVGNWRGIFWHKNHLGSTSAIFNLILLYSLVTSKSKPKAIRLILFLFYVLTWVLILNSRSATGLIAGLATNGCFACLWLWLQVRSKLTKRIYLMLGLSTGLLGVLGFKNLELILGLFNRSATLTGRIPLWRHIFTEYLSDRLWLGYGFGAFWNIVAHRLEIREVLGWPYPVLIGDNGFMDIALHVGIVGLFAFVGFYVVFLLRAGRQFFVHGNLAASFPLLLWLLSLLLNTGFSMFFETESFLGFLLFIFLPTPGQVTAPGTHQSQNK